MSGIITGNLPVGAGIPWSPPSIEDDFQSKVTQMINRDIFLFGDNYDLELRGDQNFVSVMTVIIGMLSIPMWKQM